MEKMIAKKRSPGAAVLAFLLTMFTGMNAFAQPLQVDAGPGRTICPGQTTMIGGSPSAQYGNPPYTYSWQPAALLNNPTLANPIAHAPIGFNTFTLTVTDAIATVMTSTVSVTVNDTVYTDAGIDQYVCLGAPVTFTANGSTNVVSYLWSYDDGVTSTTINSAHSFSAPGTYHVSLMGTSAQGCSYIDTQMVYVYALPLINSVTVTDVTCNGFCNGSVLASVTGGGGYSYSWSGFGSTTNPATGICSGSSSTLVVTDGLGCKDTSTSVTVNEPPVLVNTTNGTVFICGGDSATLVATGSGGVPPYYYTWDSGSGPVTLPGTITIAPTTSINYTVSVHDANGCSSGATAGVSLNVSKNISGNVTYSGGPLANGVNKAVLLSYMPSYISFDTLQIVTLDPGGNYVFPAVNTASYLIKIFPDAAMYPQLVPTYYGNQYLWDVATVLPHSCGSASSADIVMVETSSATGPGFLLGHIQEGDGFGRVPGDPVPGIDVKLGRNPGGQMIAQTETDNSGNYSFSNVPLNSGSDYYTIYVDIAGLERDSVYNVTLTPFGATYTQLDYVVDSNSIYPVYPVSVSVKNPSLAADAKFTVYPNPASAATTISYTLNADAAVKLNVYDVLGKKVETLVNTQQQSGAYKVNLAKLKAGIYFITLNINNNSNTTRLVVTD